MNKITANMRVYARKIGQDDIIEHSNFVGMVPVNAQRGFDAKVKYSEKPSAKEKLLTMSNLSELIKIMNIELKKSSGVHLLNPAYDILVTEIKSVKSRCIGKLSSVTNMELSKLKSEILENRQQVISNLVLKGRNEIEIFENEAFEKLQKGGSIEEAGQQLQQRLQSLMENELRNAGSVIKSHIDLNMPRFKDMKIDNIVEAEKWTLDFSNIHNNFKINYNFFESVGASELSEMPIPDTVKEGKTKVIAPLIGGAGSVITTGGVSLPIVALAFVVGKLFDAKKKQAEMERQIEKFNEAAEERVNALVSQVFELNNKLRMEINRMEQEYEASVVKIVEEYFSGILYELESKISISSQEEDLLNKQIHQADVILERLNMERI